MRICGGGKKTSNSPTQHREGTVRVQAGDRLHRLVESLRLDSVGFAGSSKLDLIILVKKCVSYLIFRDTNHFSSLDLNHSVNVGFHSMSLIGRLIAKSFC